MTEGNASEPVSKKADAKITFVRGFLLRALCGIVGMAVVVLVRPDFLREKFNHVFWFSAGLYLCVCIAGGAFDAMRGKAVRLRFYTADG